MRLPMRLSPEFEDDIAQALARLRFVRDVDKDHPVMPRLPHPIDCDVCIALRRLDLLLDQIPREEKPVYAVRPLR